MRKGIEIPNWYKKNRIVSLRKENGYNQTDVAAKIGCVLKTYQNYEQGRNYPTLEYATKLSELYNVSIDYLLGRSEYTSVENEEIGKIIGLNNASIATLKFINMNNGVTQSGHNERNTLNILLSNSECTIHFLGALQDFLNIRYKIPVYHSGKHVIVDNYIDESLDAPMDKVSVPECIVPNSEFDVIKNGNTEVYFLTLAKDKDKPYENYQIPLTTNFFESIALKTIERSIIDLKNSLNENE